MSWSVDEYAQGSPAAYAMLAAALDEVAVNASEVRSDLELIRRNVDGSIWRGSAADSFADEIGKLPDQLTKLFDSYSSAAEALFTYGVTLEGLRRQASAAAREGVAAESAELTAHQSRSAAAAADAQVRSSAPPDMPPPPPADLSGHDRAIDAARQRISAARSELDGVRQERESAESVAADRIHAASKQGIKNDPWWKRALKATLRGLGAICRVMAIVLLVIAIIVIIVVMAVSGLGLLAGFLLGLAIAGPILAASAAFQAGALASDAGLKLMGESDRSWLSMGIEAALLALPVVGSKASPFVSKLAMGERLAARSTRFAAASSKFRTANGEAMDWLARRSIGSDTSRLVRTADDAPTGWSGEGRSLTPEQNGMADAIARRAAANEPSISARMQEIERRVPSARLEGFEFRLKASDSLKRKFADQVERLGLAGAVSDIKDSVRYTVVVDEGDYVAQTNRVIDELSSAGFTPVKVSNSWRDPSRPYQGINTFWRDSKTGQVFELQLHTPASFDAKMATHEIYERVRIGAATAEDLELERQIFGAVPIPDRAGGVGITVADIDAIMARIAAQIPNVTEADEALETLEEVSN
jgi:uncharacterized protein YukE